MKNFTQLLQKIKIKGIYIALVITLIGFSNKGTAQSGCTISVAGCPSPSVAPECADEIVGGIFGTYVNWTPPNFSISCPGDVGSDYDFTTNFDLPESQNNCWIYNYVQRTGTGGGRIRLYQSSGVAGTLTSFTTPSFFLVSNPINASFTLTNGSGAPLVCKVYLVLANGTRVTTPVATINTAGTGAYPFTINPATVGQPAGTYRLMYEFTGNGNNADYIDILAIDAALISTSCGGDINFFTISTANPGSFFPVGTTPVSYTSTCNSCIPVMTKNCDFNVIVNGVTATATSTNSNCGTNNGGITITATTSNPSPALEYNLNNTGWISFNSPTTLSNISSGINTINVRDNFANIPGYCQILTPLSVTVGQSTDNTNPTINCPTTKTIDGCNTNAINVANTGLAYSATPLVITQAQFLATGATASDNCTFLTYKYQDSQSGICPIVVTRTFTVTDGSGHSANCSQIINIQDTTAPVLSGQGLATTISCPATPSFTAPTATDTCDATPTITFADVTVAGACAGTYTTTRTWTATDDCGNVSSTVSQAITVQDNTAPVLSGQGVATTISCPATPSFTAPTAADTCDATPTITFEDVTVAGACAGTYTTTRTWTATDDCGNVSSTVSQAITVQDNTAPVLSGQGLATTISCPATPSFTAPTATDTCDATPTITFADVTTAGACAGSYSVTRTWTATDDCGNSSTASQTINIQDTTAPVIAALPAPSTIGCPATPVFAVATATDTCGSAFTLTSADVTTPGACAGSYSVTRTWTATDACGNTSTAAQTINVQDTTAPVIAALPAPSTINCPATPVFAVATATDACGSAFTLTSADVTTPGACTGSYSVTRTWTATDACGNTSTATQTINVQDITPPTITTVGADQTVLCNGTGNNTEFQAWLNTNAGATATDNCSNVTWSYEILNIITQCGGTSRTLVRFVATDACNNSSNTTALFTIIDLVPPTLNNTAKDLTVECDGNGNTIELNGWLNNNGGATATDLCSNITWSNNFTSLSDECGNTGSANVTFKATDACGNFVTTTAKFIIKDTTAPVAPLAPSNQTVACASEVPVAQPLTASDNCSGTITAQGVDTVTPGSCPNSFTVTRTWTFTDACSNSSTTTQTITVSDTVAPIIAALPAASTISCPAAPVFAQATATDNCGSVVTLTSTDVTTPGACAGSYSVTRTWTAKDACGNESSASQTINVSDTTAPVIAALPAASTISCPATPVFTQATANDNCGSAVTLTSADVTTPGACTGSYSVTRTWTAKDACGNEATASQTINVSDTVAPTITNQASNISVECDGTGNQNAIKNWLASNGGATATDACSDVTWTNDFNALANDCSAAVTVIFTATDACGNASTTSATFSVKDVTAPVAPAAPANQTVACASEIPVAQPLTASDNCSGTITAQGVDTVTPGSCPNSFTVTRTWTFTDACNNSSTATQTITVSDTVAPVIAALPAASTISCPAAPEFAQATATDNCGSAVTLTSADVTTPGACAGSYSVTRTWTAKDACGNTSTASQTINVTDTVAPVIAALPTESTISCPAAPEFAQATATDECGSAFTLTSADVTTPGACAGSYSVTRTWTAKDACGNTSTASQTIIVTDTTAPVIAALPAESTISCPAAPVFAQATATDNCGSAFTLTSADVTTPGTCAGSYSVTRTWTAKDACGNEATASQTINVSDTVAPTITNQASNISVECDGTGNQNAIKDWLASNGGATATDACSDVTWTNDFNALANDCSAAVTVIFTATDACGNASTTSATFSVKDVTAPVAPAAPANQTVACASEVPASESLTATDNCSGTITAEGVDTVTPGSCPNSFTVTRTWTFTDACNNSSTATQTITVSDTVAPVIAALPTESTISCPDAPEFAQATATDNCDSAVTLTSADVTTPGACAGSYSVTRTWTAKDACGNTSTASQTINVTDTVAPVIASLPIESTIFCPAAPVFAQATATDECGSDFTLTSADVTTPGACAGSYSITRTWTAKDACGNTSTASQTIIVTDTTAPVIAALPAESTISCPDAPEFTQATATDECGSDFTLTSADVTTPGTCAGSYSVTRTWTAKDACGNETTASQTINVSDTVAPTITNQASNISVECDGTGNQNAINDWLASNGGATATDACSDVTWTNDFNALANDCSAAVTVIFTATDACGNASATSATFSVKDVTAPVAPAAPENQTVACASEVPVSESLTATDNCSGTITAEGVDTVTPGSCPNSFTVTRTWTFTDACSNSSTATQTITVSDTVAPVIAALPTESTISCPAAPEFAQATATDNCDSAVTLTSADVTTPGACAGSYSVTRTWTAKDACGNEATASQTIIITDTVAPIIAALPAESTISCPAAPEFIQATATDECGSDFTLTSADVTTPGTCAGSYSVTRTWTAKDACGNESSTSQTINVTDTVAPVIAALPTESTISCPAAPEFAEATATDECGSDFTLTSADVTTPGTCAGSYSVTRTWTAKDACGNESSASQTINVTDTVAPVIAALPTESTISCPDAPEFAEATATDECGSDFTLTSADVTTPGENSGIYSITRTWTATDVCGNTSTASQTINVSDTTAPIAPVLADVIGQCSATATVPSASDSCVGEVTGTTADPLTYTTPGTYVIHWIFDDGNGNISTADQTVKVTSSSTTTTVPGVAKCNNDTDLLINLTLLLPQGTTTGGTWTNVDNVGELVTNDGNEFFKPYGVAVGNYTFSYVVPKGDCTETVNIDMKVDDDCAVLPCGDINVSSYAKCNDDPDAEVNLTSLLPVGTPSGGEWTNVDNVGELVTKDGEEFFKPFGAPVGNHIIKYDVLNVDCLQTVNVDMEVDDDCQVKPECNLLVHNAFSPNGDGINDVFQIENVENRFCFPNVDVQVYNRWGVLVFETKDYNNNDRAFRGYSEGRTTISKSEGLPTGTYFYTIQYTNAEGNNINKDGYLYLSR